MNGRVYDPVLGRFLSADPIVDDVYDSQSHNPYSYCANNPLNTIDPSGYLKLGDVAKFVGAAVAGFLTAGVALYAYGTLVVGGTFAGGFVGALGCVGTALAGSGTWAAVAAFGAGFGSAFAGSLLNGGSIGDALRAGAIHGGFAAVGPGMGLSAASRSRSSLIMHAVAENASEDEPGLGRTIIDFASGVAAGWHQDNNPFASEPVPFSEANRLGIAAGHLLSIYQSTKEMGIGGGVVVLSGAGEFVTAGGGTPVAVPVALGGAAIAIHGGYVGYQGASNLIKMEMRGRGGEKPQLPDQSGPRPTRVTNPKHHPKSASPEPANVDELYQHSIVDAKGVRWAKDPETGIIHRFSKPTNGETHWNGSTGTPVDPIPLREIPNVVLKAL
jgi:hypothetical protein